MSKKLLALVLAFALVFSTFTAAFAAEALPADAQAAATLGMLKGDTSAGVTSQYLATAPTRLQAAILFLRLKGLENAALAYSSTVNFPDANTTLWQGGRNIMAYLKNHPELGWIGDNGNFKANDKMNAQAYYKVMLESLGYKQNTTDVIGDFTYDQTIAFAASKGLTKVAGVTNFTVADVATATIEALKANVKGSTKTLAASLVEAGILNAQAAVAAGVYTVAPTALAVESVSSTNLKEISVVFNKGVDKTSAQDLDNYTLEVNNAEVALDSATLAADGKTVTLVLDGQFVNGSAFDLSIADVKDTSAGVIADTTITASSNDVAAPVAQSAAFTGPSTLEITFNEPVSAGVAGSVQVGGAEFPVASVVANDTRTVVVQMSDAELAAQGYKVSVADFKDLAGHKMVAKDFDVNYVKDTMAPTATIVSATQTQVVVQFNEKVFAGDPDANTSLDANYFYHSFSSYVPVTATTTDNKKFTLSFPAGNNPLPEGTVKVVIVNSVNDQAITDAWGNQVASNIVLTANVAADTTKPVVTKVETDGQDTLKVYFSEDVNADTATDFDNYTVLNSSSEEQTISDITYSNADDVYVATITFGGNLDPANYSVKVANVTDKALDANKMVSATVSFVVADEIGPMVPTASIGVDGTTSDSIYIEFGEDLASTGAYSALDKKNYQIDGKDLATGDTVSFFNGDKSIVKITLADETAYNFAGNETATVTVARLADAAGNKMDALFGTTTAAKESAIAVNSLRVIDGKTIEIRINSNINAATPASAFKVTANGSTDTLASIKSITWVAPTATAAGYTKVIGVLKAAQQVQKDADGYYETGIGANDYAVQAASATAVKSIYGTAMAVASYNTTTDKFAPSLETIVNTATDKITLTFTEDLAYASSGNDVLAATDLVIKKLDGTRLIPNADYTVTISNDTLVITLIGSLANYNGKLTVETAANMNYLADGSNKVVAFSKTVTMVATH